MGLVDFGKDLVGTAANVVKGAAYVADPTHLDDIAKGGVKAAQFVAEHPGQTLDIAKTVATEVGKDMLDPKQLALTAGLALATGGAGVVASTLAKGALATKSIATGLEVAKGADTALDIAKGVTTAAKTADKIGDAVKVADKVTDAAKVVDKATDVGKTLSKTEKVAQTVLGEKPGLVGKILNPLENSGGRLGNFTMGAQREKLAQHVLSKGGEAPTMGRQIISAAIQGSGKGTGVTQQLAGMSDEVYDVQKAAWKGRAVANRVKQGQAAQTGAEIGADPVGYAADQAKEQVTNRINESGHDAGYTDRGSTVESLYGNTSQTATPGSATQTRVEGGSQLRQPGSSTQTGGLYQPPTTGYNGAANQRQGGLGQVGRDRVWSNLSNPAHGLTPAGMSSGGSGKPPGPPTTMSSATPSGPDDDWLGTTKQNNWNQPATPTSGLPSRANWNQPATPNATLPSVPGIGSNAPAFQPAEQTGSRTSRRSSGTHGAHFWQGPSRQAFGGIKSNFDWRSVEPLRPITAGGVTYNSTDPQTSGVWGTQSAGSEEAASMSSTQRRVSGRSQQQLNEQGAPANFSPEVPKSGMYAQSQGQATADTALPKTSFDMTNPTDRAEAQTMFGGDLVGPHEIDMRTPEGRAEAQKVIGQGGKNVRSGKS